jgi:hypothetical protein
MLLVWLIALILLMREVGRLAGVRWEKGLTFLMSGLALLLVLYQAPNLFHALYWRDGLVGYTVPLILSTCAVVLILWSVRPPSGNRIGLALAMLGCFALVFLAGGTSETTSALQIGVVGLLFVATGPYAFKNRYIGAVVLLCEAMIVALVSMGIMASAPGNLVRLRTPESNLVQLTAKTLTYSVQFIGDALRTKPLASAVTILVPALMAYIFPNQHGSTSSRTPSARIGWVMLLILSAAFLLIAVSFAPSAYAQSYPVAHARFPALYVLILALMAVGVGPGILFHRLFEPITGAPLVQIASSVLLGALLVVYPLRTAFTVYAATSEYRAWSAAWDQRQALILAQRAAGVQDIVVPQLAGVFRTKELDSNPHFRLNGCASMVYGVRSITASPHGP